jgi:ketosteroid isomerase-like protein
MEETMQSPHHAAANIAALGREWIAAWNSHDLESVLALYADDAEMTSDKIQALGLAARCAARTGFGRTGARRWRCCRTCGLI